MTAPRLGYIGNPLDRAHDRRTDAAWVADQLGRSDARLMVLARERVLYVEEGNPAATSLMPRETGARLQPGDEVLLLGLDDAGRPVLAGEIDPVDRDDDLGSGIEHRDLRSFALQGAVPAEEVAMAALARSLLAWHRSHRFCSSCGKPSKVSLGGFRRDCPDCGAQHFPRTDPVTIMLVTDGDRALLARSPHFAPGMFSAIAGFVEPGETIEEAVVRETLEETGLEVGHVTYHMSQPWPFPSSLMIACYAEATTTALKIDPEELEDAMWVTRDQARAALRGEADFNVPPPIAIAHHLVLGFAEA